jgi:hypothetical protein
MEFCRWEDTNFVRTEDILYIPNGSLLSFRGEGAISQGIRNKTREVNSLGLSPVGIALVGTPLEMIAMVQQTYACGVMNYSSNPKIEKSIMYMFEHISNIQPLNKPDVFCLHSTGGDGVHIDLLKPYVEHYRGMVFIRCLDIDKMIPLQTMFPAVVVNLGKRYNSSITQLLLSISDSNRTTNNNTKFCSQLAADLYKECGVISRDIISTNVTPADFASESDTTDLLRDHALIEFPLKILQPNVDGGCVGCNVY